MDNAIFLEKEGFETDSLRTEAVEKILNAIQSVHFGSVEIVIHNSQVVQIERKEKIRLDLPVRI